MRTVLKQGCQFSAQNEVKVTVRKPLYLWRIAQTLVAELRKVSRQVFITRDEHKNLPNGCPFRSIDSLLLLGGQQVITTRFGEH